MARTILFDLDGTLIDSAADLAMAVNLTRRDFGLPPKSLPEVISAVGNGVRKLLERTIPECADRMEELLARQRKHYGDHLLDQTALYPGVEETLRRLAGAGHRLGVVTNKPAAATHAILEGLGILPLFGAVIGGGDCAKLKPDPEPLFLAAERLGTHLTPDDWMVGDSFTDLGAGRNAGIKRCFCTFGFGRQGDEAYDIAIDRMDRLNEAIVR